MKKKMEEIHQDLNNLLEYITTTAPPHRFLSEITESINEMINELENTKTISERLRKLALGLGIYITDDFEFSEGETGSKILEVVNSIVRSE